MSFRGSSMQQLEFNSEEVLFKEQLETEDSRIGYCFLRGLWMWFVHLLDL